MIQVCKERLKAALSLGCIKPWIINAKTVELGANVINRRRSLCPLDA
jgi:hypothetical protein